MPSPPHKKLLAVAAALVVLLVVSVAPASAVTDPQPPSDLTVQDVEWNAAEVTWSPSPTAGLWRYEVVDLDSGRMTITGPDIMSARITGLHADRTYRFGVRAGLMVDGQSVRSSFSNTVTLHTPLQILPVPTQLTAQLDDRAVTLSWNRPTGAEHGPTFSYLVYDGEDLETTIHGSTAGAVVEHHIPRLSSGQHDFTVRIRYSNPIADGPGVSEASNTASVVVGSLPDTVPPARPIWLTAVHDCDTYDDWYEFTPTTDDVTPPSLITYERVALDRRTGQTAVVADQYDIPSVGNPWSIEGVRAVDEAGNRSDVTWRASGIALRNC